MSTYLYLVFLKFVVFSNSDYAGDSVRLHLICAWCANMLAILRTEVRHTLFKQS